VILKLLIAQDMNLLLGFKSPDRYTAQTSIKTKKEKYMFLKDWD